MADNINLCDAGGNPFILACKEINGIKYLEFIASDVNGGVIGGGHSATVIITRPSNASPYDAGDVIGDTGGSAIFTFANMGKAGGEVYITAVELEIDVAAIPTGMAGFMLHLYNDSPTAIADNAAWDLLSGDRGKYLKSIQLNAPTDMGSTLFSQNDNIDKPITLTTSSLYVEMPTLGAFTPGSADVYRLTIHTVEA